MGFSRQEYWSGSPLPSPGDLPKPGIEPWSTALQANSLLSELPGKGPTINQRLKLTPWCHSLTLLWISYPISQRMLKTLFLKYGFFSYKNLATSHHLNHYLRYCPMSRSFLEHLCQISAPFPGQHPLYMHVYPIPIQCHRRDSILLSFHICLSLIREWKTWLLSLSYKKGLRDQIKHTEKSESEVSSWPKMVLGSLHRVFTFENCVIRWLVLEDH